MESERANIECTYREPEMTITFRGELIQVFAELVMYLEKESKRPGFKKEFDPMNIDLIDNLVAMFRQGNDPNQQNIQQL